jgi:hypothetical protein
VIAEGVQFVVMTATGLAQYNEIKASGDEQATDLARRRLLTQLLVTGALTLLAVKGNIADFRKGRSLYLDLDLGADAMARPMMTEADLIALMRKTPGFAMPEELSRLLARPDISQDLAMRIRADITQALPRGEVASESIQRVLSAMRRGENATQIEQALAELRNANRVTLAGSVAQGGQMHIGVAKGAEVDPGNGQRLTLEHVDEADLLYLGADGKIHPNEVKNTAQGLADKLGKTPKQLENMRRWKADDPGKREIGVVIETDLVWTDVFGSSNAMRRLIDQDIPLHIADRVWSPAKMQEIWDATVAKARELGMYPPKREFFDKMATLDEAERFLGISLR